MSRSVRRSSCHESVSGFLNCWTTQTIGSSAGAGRCSPESWRDSWIGSNAVTNELSMIPLTAPCENHLHRIMMLVPGHTAWYKWPLDVIRNRITGSTKHFHITYRYRFKGPRVLQFGRRYFRTVSGSRATTTTNACTVKADDKYTVERLQFFWIYRTLNDILMWRVDNIENQSWMVKFECYRFTAMSRAPN